LLSAITIRVGSGSVAPSLPQDHGHDDGGDEQDRHGIDHGRLDLGGQLDGFLDVGREALEDGVENAARFAGCHHVGEEPVKGAWMLAHRVGKRHPAFHGFTGLENGNGKTLVRFLRSQDLQTLHQRQTGVDHDAELTREDGQALVRHPAAGLRDAARGLDLDGVDACDEDLLAPERCHNRVD
jgi:hypothetical protein